MSDYVENKIFFEAACLQNYFYNEQNSLAFKKIMHNVHSRSGISVIVGNAGVGKTSLLNQICQELKDDNISFSYINNTTGRTPNNLLYAIAIDFGLSIPQEKENNIDFINNTLQAYFIENYKKNINNLIIIDEANHLDQYCIETLRMLSNTEIDNIKIVQMILSGQNELEKVIAQLPQLKGRIQTFVKLKEFSASDTMHYINHKFEKYEKSIRINWGSAYFVWKYSQGNIREINRIMKNVLIIMENKGHLCVNKKYIKQAFKNIPHIGVCKKQFFSNKNIFILVLLILLSITLYFMPYAYSFVIDKPQEQQTHVNTIKQHIQKVEVDKLPKIKIQKQDIKKIPENTLITEDNGEDIFVEWKSPINIESFYPGFSDNNIKIIQDLLQKKGFFIAKPDGIVNKNTWTAIANFQKKYNLEITGMPNHETLFWLYSKK